MLCPFLPDWPTPAYTLQIPAYVVPIPAYSLPIPAYILPSPVYTLLSTRIVRRHYCESRDPISNGGRKVVCVRGWCEGEWPRQECKAGRNATAKRK